MGELWTNLHHGLVIALSGIGSTLIATRVILHIAPRFGLVDKPNARKIHSSPIPRVGGIAIIFGLLISLTVGSWIGSIDLRAEGIPSLLLGTLGMFLLGFVDDIFELSAPLKLCTQIAIASSVVYGGGGFNADGLAFGPDPWLCAVISVVWLVAVTNAVNLIDGMDSLASGVGILVAVTLGTTSFLVGVPTPTIIALGLVSSLTGFFAFNYHPARIFMGDCGSLSLGFILAGLALRTSPTSPSLGSFLAPLVMFGFPLFEAFFSIVRRILVGRSPFTPDRDHIHHHLLAKGLPQRQAAGILHGFTLLFCLASLRMQFAPHYETASMIILFGLFIVASISHLDYFPEIFATHLRVSQARTIRRPRSKYQERWWNSLHRRPLAMEPVDLVKNSAESDRSFLPESDRFRPGSVRQTQSA